MAIDALQAVMDQDVHSLLSDHANRRPDAPFLHWEPFTGAAVTYSYKDFYTQVCALAGGLKSRGVKPGGYLMLHAVNAPEYLMTWHACAMLGAIVVTTNPRSVQDEMDYFIDHSKPRWLVTQPAFLHLFETHTDKFEWIACMATDGGEISDVDIPDGVFSFDSLSGDAAAYTHKKIDPMASLSVQYTSGTTSRPKGVVWTHANAIWGGQVGAAHLQLRTDDIAMVFTPLCHTNAMSWTHFPVLWSGGAMVMHPKFSASRYWPAVQKHNCTWGNAIPFAVQALAMQPVPENHTIRLWVVGAANVGPIEKHFGITFIGAWGMTEIVTHGTYTPMHLSAPTLSMGMPVPEFELAVLDANDDAVEPGEVGLLKIRGKRGVQIFLEYLNNPEATNSSFDADGWFDTGDRVRQVEGGHLRFSDRAKDMLRVGGENVSASEVEAVIAGVVGVVEAALVGKPDKMRGELPVAFVRAAESTHTLKQKILEACQKNLAAFKVPVEVIFLDDFPRSELNKIAKVKLRDMLKAQ